MDSILWTNGLFTADANSWKEVFSIVKYFPNTHIGYKSIDVDPSTFTSSRAVLIVMYGAKFDNPTQVWYPAIFRFPGSLFSSDATTSATTIRLPVENNNGVIIFDLFQIKYATSGWHFEEVKYSSGFDWLGGVYVFDPV